MKIWKHKDITHIESSKTLSDNMRTKWPYPHVHMSAMHICIADPIDDKWQQQCGFWSKLPYPHIPMSANPHIYILSVIINDKTLGNNVEQANISSYTHGMWVCGHDMVICSTLSTYPHIRISSLMTNGKNFRQQCGANDAQCDRWRLNCSRPERQLRRWPGDY